MSEGWISLHRKLQDNEFWTSERFTKGQAWVDLILLANFKDNILFIRGNEVRIKRGQFIHSLDTLGHRWKWNKRTVTKFLNMLCTREMLHRRISNVCTINTILNYNQYQDNTPQSTPQSALQSTRRVHHNNKDNKENNVNTLTANAGKTINQFTIGTMPISLKELSDDTITYESLDPEKKTPKKYKRNKIYARIAVEYMHHKGETGNVLRYYRDISELVDLTIEALKKDEMEVNDNTILESVLWRFNQCQLKFKDDWGFGAVIKNFNRMTTWKL